MTGKPFGLLPERSIGTTWVLIRFTPRSRLTSSKHLAWGRGCVQLVGSQREGGSSVQRPTSLSAAGLARLAPVLGLSLGIGIVVNHPLRRTPGWPVWAVLALALTTTAGAVAVYGLERWAELAALHIVRVRAVARPVLTIRISDRRLVSR
jgi:hypothetical protein